MYSDDKKQQIIDSLLDGTKSGYIKWLLSNSSFNKDTSHKMEYTSSDKLTRFSIDVNLEDSLLCVGGGSAYLYIHNDDLVDKRLQIPSSEFQDVKLLEELIYDKFVKPVVMKSLPKAGVLDSIVGNINKQHHREEQIDDILGNPYAITDTGRTEAEVIEEYLENKEKSEKKPKKKKYWFF